MTAEEIKAIVASQNYYNRYDKNKKWSYIAVLAGRALQSAEFNELQNVLEERTQAIGASLYEDGMILDGCDITFTSATKVTLKSGTFFADGLAYSVKEKSITVSTSETLLGIWKINNVLTEYDDDTLRDPTRGFPQYKMPGAYRILTTVQWGQNNEIFDNAHFYPVYRVINGQAVCVTNTAPNTARYDNDALGNYAVKGLGVSFVSALSGKQTFRVAKGLAHINGYETELLQDTNLIVDEVLDGEDIIKEVTQSETLPTGENRIVLNHLPVERVSMVRVTKQRTVNNITHGATGSADQLPDDSVTRIIEVKQGAKIYVEGTDFTFSSDTDCIDWFLAGDEPTAGSKYTVTYEYRVNASFTFDATSVTVTDTSFLHGEPIDIIYGYRMPRKDIVVLRSDSSIDLIRGIPNAVNPIVPVTPDNTILLAEVAQTWVEQPAIKIPARNIREQIAELYTLIDELKGGE